MNWKLSLYLILSCPILAEVKPTPQRCACRSGCQSRQPASAPVVPIMLDDCGPNPSPLPPINAPPLQTPLINKPPVALPACVPPTKTIGNTCHCVKTVVKPQVVQQLISVPSIQRYIETTHTPVLEHIHYHGVPINCPPYAPELPTASQPPTAVSSAPAKPSSLTPYLTLGTAKPPALPCLSLPTPPPSPPTPTPSISPTLLALLASLSSASRASSPPASSALSPCTPVNPSASLPPFLSFSALPPCPPSSLSASLPCLPPCPPSPAPCLPLTPCLLSLLSKLMLR